MTRRLLGLGVLVASLGCGGGVAQESITLPAATASSLPSPTASVTLVKPSGKDEGGAAVPISRDDPWQGSPNALVTIVEFSDFQCPFCARVVPTLEQLRQDYDEETLRLVFKHMPLAFHPNAQPCAEAAATVWALGGNAAFWTFHDLAFHDQQNLNPFHFDAWAQKAGVGLREFQAALSLHRFAAKVDEDVKLAGQLGVNGTPGFFVNGISLSGAQPLTKFKELVDAQIVAARAKLAAGVPRASLYTVLTNENIKKNTDDTEEDPRSIFKVPVGSSPQLGPRTALVTIVEFSDFQCPYCKRVQATLQQVRSTYGAQVRLVFKHMPLPFHPRAVPAAELALEARAEKGDAGFWAAHDALFDAQPQLEDADLDAVAAKVHLDVAKVRAAIAQNRYQATLDQDQNEGDDFAASGTPHFFINGRRLVGAQPFERFKVVIDEELTKAKAAVSAGTKAEDVYTELTKGGQGPTPPTPITVTLVGTAPSRGPVGATVTVVEFGDFQDPFSKKADATVLDLLKAYPTSVRLVWRHDPLPSHAQAGLAAEASVEAFLEKGNDGFWKMHDALFAHQTDPDGLKRTNIDGYAQTLGLDATRFRRALDSGLHASTVDADVQSVRGIVTGTPSFLVGRGPATGTWSGVLLTGAQPLRKLRRLVDLALTGSHP